MFGFWRSFLLAVAVVLPCGCRKTPQQDPDVLVHPETTPDVKWVRMTKPTRDALMDVYAAHLDDCERLMAANNRVTIGEAAILWLMQHAKE